MLTYVWTCFLHLKGAPCELTLEDYAIHSLQLSAQRQDSARGASTD